MKSSDYIVNLLVNKGLDTFFVVTGGAIAPLIDSIASNPSTKLFAFQHEQSAAMACEGFFRETGKIGVCLVTSGPGIQNTLNGVCGCWYDSIPALIISGQVNTTESLDSIKERAKPRQKGFQEMPVVDTFKNFTVFSEQIKSVDDIFKTFSDAIKKLETPRFGPALIDLPVDIQMSNKPSMFDYKRTLIIYGNGVRLSKSENLARKLNIPFVTSWGAKDLFPTDHMRNYGCIGVYGSRCANLAVQNAEFLIVIGSRLDSRQTGSSHFSKHSKKLIVDIDEEEIKKSSTPIHYCSNDINTFLLKLSCEEYLVDEDWLTKLDHWRTTYSFAIVDNERYNYKNSVYTFLETLSNHLPSNATIIPDTGGNVVWSMQSINIKEGQRMYTNLGNSSMGFSLPCAIGAAISDPSRLIVCIIGDGGLQMNIQELKTVVDYNLNIKIFVINNSGYGIIKQFQDAYFDSRYNVTHFESPDFCSIAKAYGMDSITIRDESFDLSLLFRDKKSILVNVIIDPNQKIMPKLEFGNSLENMYPFIPIDELEEEMIYKVNQRVERKGWVYDSPSPSSKISNSAPK